MSINMPRESLEMSHKRIPEKKECQIKELMNIKMNPKHPLINICTRSDRSLFIEQQLNYSTIIE